MLELQKVFLILQPYLTSARSATSDGRPKAFLTFACVRILIEVLAFQRAFDSRVQTRCVDSLFALYTAAEKRGETLCTAETRSETHSSETQSLLRTLYKRAFFLFVNNKFEFIL